MNDVEWHGDELRRRIEAIMARRLEAAAIQVETHAKRLVSVPGTGRVRGRKAGPVAHAPAGEPPYKQTGRLRASIAHELDASGRVARVGTNVKYGRFLELGLGVGPHPWLRRSLAEKAAAIRATLVSPI